MQQLFPVVLFPVVRSFVRLSFAECQICCPRVVRLFFSSETLEPNFNDILKNNTDRQFRSDWRIMSMSATRNTKELTNK